MKINRIKQKMILLIFITLIPLSILKIAEIKRETELSVESELEANQDYAKAINLAFMNFVERTWSSQYIMGKYLVGHIDIKGAEVRRYFNSITLKDYPIRMHYFWATPDGIINASSEELNTVIDVSGRDFFREIISGREKVIGNLEHSVINGELMISIARGITEGGELRGIVINSIEINDIRYILPIIRMNTESTFGLVDRNGSIAYSNGKNHTGIRKIELSEDSPTGRALKGEIVQTHPFYCERDGVEKVIVDYPINEIQWSSFVATSIDELLANRRQELERNIRMFALVYIISFIMALLISGKFIESVEKLKLTAQKVKNGELNVKTGIAENDDLGDVGQAFDNMVEVLRERAREEKEYNDLKSQFLATISHEFKTPLNIILGSIQLLEGSNINDEDFYMLFNKYIKMQKQNSYRLLRLISNFIDITKVENNFIKTRFQNDDIIRVVEDITMSVVEYTKLKDISIVFDTDVEEKIISFDADMIERIILNLLSNSIKFTEPGGSIEVNICTKDNIKISIKDSGIGIPQNKLEAIFNRYVQVDNHLRRPSEGSGIGLSLVKSLVELHDGTIFVESELGNGTEVVIVLPDKTSEGSDIERYKERNYNTERIHVEFSDIYV